MGRRRAKVLERADFSVREWKVDAAQGIFEGYLAVFNNIDSTDDICEPGCFKKTLADAYQVKQQKGTAFLFPLLWMHDEKMPCGGFYEMYEDRTGLYVKGQVDINTPLGQYVFSGMDMGWAGQMSIGYQAVRATRDSKGTRHLLEVKLWEGSAVTTGFAANDRADILLTKSLFGTTPEHKGACGKTSWPFGERDAAWDVDAAHKNIVAWATDDDGKVDVAKMKSVHFWYDPDNADQLGGYKLLFCDVVGGNVKAMPKGIQACWGSHGVEAADIPSADVAGVKAKLSTYGKRLAKEFDDDGLIAPWDRKKRAIRAGIDELKMSGLQMLTYGLANIDEFGEYMDCMLERIGDTCGLNLDPDEGYEEAAEVGEQMAAGEVPGMAVHPSVAALLDNLPGLKEGLLALGNAFQALDDATDTVLDLLGMEPADYGYGMMSAHRPLSVKVSRSLSSANRQTIQGVMDGLMSHHKALDDMLESNDSGKSSRTSPELRATTTPDSPAPEPSATTQDSDDLGLLMSKMKVGAI